MKLSTTLCLALVVAMCYFVTVESSPIAKDDKKNEVAASRQSGPVQSPAIPGEEESDEDDDDDDDDDEDDDEEDELDDPFDDDDDDEEDDAVATGNQAPGATGNQASAGSSDDDDDDEDDDYVGDFFDGVFGDDDDDDDEDDEDDSPVQSPAAAQQQVAQQAVAQPSTVEAADSAQPEGVSDNLDELSNDVPNGESDAPKDPQQAALDQAATINNNIDPVDTGAVVDDEDDDDDEDIEDALDDDDDDDDDDDEDDDDDLGGELIEAKANARAMDGENAPETMNDMFVSKYNKFVDGIFTRINTILKKSYDPVNVALSMDGAEVKTAAATKKANKKKRNNSKKNKKSKPSTAAPVEAMKARAMEEEKASSMPAVAAVEKPKVKSEKPKVKQQNTSNKKNKRKNNNNNSTKKQPAAAAAAASTVVESKTQTPKQAKATLFGLSSLKRVGNVKVTPSGDYTTVKSNFALGPLMLKVEKMSGKPEKRDIKMATATTHEIFGKINIRVVNGKASLHSIKVQQPKQVKVDSADSHDRTRQYVEEQQSHIARVVSKKLRNAAKSMFKEPQSI